MRHSGWSKRKRRLILAVLAGMLVGLGLFTANYASGLSYLSNDPRACANCHIMNEQLDSWAKGPHHAWATCNDCHVPPHFPWKYRQGAQRLSPLHRLHLPAEPPR